MSIRYRPCDSTTAKDVRDPSMKEEAAVNEGKPYSGSAFQAIRAIDYTVIFVRDMAAMRRFYEDILAFPLSRELSPGWIEYRVGDNTLALARPRLTAADALQSRAESCAAICSVWPDCCAPRLPGPRRCPDAG